ncbi:hypothetical protein [Winogradskyella sp. J14-2]|uniref:hypothetical protein n=1 Tax=Winogradskyella sp. J14-2 TaxID=1936080 RepID=UPI0012F7C4F9|nr:hypothetical protein [Winogradskyella sp. J14-2]
MRFSLIFLLFLSFYFNLSAQTLKGKVYDTKTVVKDMKVINKTQNILTITNNDGDFSIQAKVNDTIIFQSIFYHPLEVVLKQSHFDDVTIFEVDEIISELNEVKITNEKKNKFDSISYYATIKTEQKHLSKKPLVKSGDNLMPTLDLKQLYKGISKLLRKRKNENIENKIPLDYQELESFFATDDFFNKELLTLDLKIPENNINLFIDYCAKKGVRKELLKDKNKMQLLEELVVHSQLFLILLEEYGEEATVKD